MLREPAKTVLVALGNSWRGDDCVGVEIARRLDARCPGRFAIRQPEDTWTLIEAWDGAPLAVVIDAAVSGARPGTIRRIVPSKDALGGGPARHSSHGLDLAQALELARALGRAPERLVVYAVEGRQFEHGARLSPEVERAIDEAIEAVLRDIG